MAHATNDELLWNSIKHHLSTSSSPLHKLQIVKLIEKDNVGGNVYTVSDINRVLYNHKTTGEVSIDGTKGKKPLWKLTQDQHNTFPTHQINKPPAWQKEEMNLHNIMDEDTLISITMQNSLDSAGLEPSYYPKSKPILPPQMDVAFDEKEDEKISKSESEKGNKLNENINVNNMYDHDMYTKRKHRPHDRRDDYTHHVSTLISEGFEQRISREERLEDVTKHYVTAKDGQYIEAYLYQINHQKHDLKDLEDEKHDEFKQHEYGVLLSSKIPDKYVHSIQFPVLIKKHIDKQLRQPMKYYLDSNTHETSFEIERSNQQISLELLPHTKVHTEHRLKPEWFHKIQNFHQFIFKQLNPNWTQEDNEQFRYYYVCPLLKSKIDFKCIHKLCTSSTLNGKQFIKTFPAKKRENSLKYEMVMYQSKYRKQLCVSQGFCKDEYMKRRQENVNQSEWSSDIGSIPTHASTTVVNFSVNDQRNQKQNNVNDYLVLIRDTAGDNIENILTKESKSINGYQLQSRMKFVPLKQIYPTGIRETQYYAALNLPSILWGIENYLNMIDLHEVLHKLGQDIHMDISMLFEALNRCVSGDQSYQRYHQLGVYVLKALLTICAFSSDVFADAQTIDTFVNERGSMKSSILQTVSQELNLLSYTITENFHFKAWHPPGFQHTNRSIYTKHKRSDMLLQSVIGAYFASAIERDPVNKLGTAMRRTWHLLFKLKIISHTNIIVDAAFAELSDCMELGADDTVDGLIEMVVVNGNCKDLISSSKILYPAMSTVCYGDLCKDYSCYGISLDRFCILGDALLDLFVMWFIYVNAAPNETSRKQVADKRKNKHELEFWQNAMSNERFRWTNQKSLATQSLTFRLHHYIRWYSKEQISKVNELNKTMNGSHKTGTTTTKGMNEIEQITPTGMDRNHGVAFNCLSRPFYALIAVGFLCGNETIYLKENSITDTNCYWKCGLCIEFLTTFLGNKKNWEQFKWRKWTS
eukprot:465451_1